MVITFKNCFGGFSCFGYNNDKEVSLLLVENDVACLGFAELNWRLSITI